MVQFNSGWASQDALYISTVALTVLAGVVVGARLITRTIFAHQTGLDDVLVTIAYVFSVIMGITIWKQTEWGMGKHITDITFSDYTKVALWFWLCYWIYYLALFFTKASILVQYLRVFPHDKLRYLSFALLAVVGAWTIWAVFSGIFMCRPVSVFWTATTLNPPQCLSRQNVFYANAAVNMATDIATFLLPLPYVYSLEIPRKQKALLMCVFGLGFFVVLTSVFRLIWIYPVTISPDITWNNPMINIWSCAEVNTGILCSCAPAMKGMIQRGFPKFLESMRSVTGKSFSFSSASRSGSDTPDGKRRRSTGLGSFVSSKLSSNKSGNRSFNRSYGGEEPLENEKAIEVRTSVVTELERNDGSEFNGRDEYGRDDRTLQGKTETMISSAGGR